MKNSYDNLRYVLPAYFTQDFDLDYDNPYDAANEIIHDNIKNPRLREFGNEIDFIIKNEENLSEIFFSDLGLDTAPFKSSKDNKDFLEYFLNEINKALQRS